MTPRGTGTGVAEIAGRLTKAQRDCLGLEIVRDGDVLKLMWEHQANAATYEYFDTGKVVDGKRVYNKLPPRSDRSWGQVYAGMVAGRHARANIAAVPTIADVSRAYQLSDKFRTKYAPSTQHTYMIYLNLIEEEMGQAEVAAVERRDVQAIMDKMADRPGAANMVLILLHNLFAFAIKREWIKTDPTMQVDRYDPGEGHEPWPDELLEAALADPAVRLPVALLYYTAQRIGDVCKMRWADFRDGYLPVKQQKTKTDLDLRIHAELATILASTPKEALTILHGAKMRPMRVATLRVQLQRWAKGQGHDVVPHGLRKNAVNALLEAGCSVGEVSAISGQSLEMIEHYSRKRNNRKMGSAAILKWERNRA